MRIFFADQLLSPSIRNVFQCARSKPQALALAPDPLAKAHLDAISARYQFIL
jgi:hypothetical protein